MIYRESKFDPDARSSSGAVGLMQLLPETAEGIALNTGGKKFVVSDLHDPEINVRYGSFYLRRLLRKYDDERLALAAYNAGQTNVDSGSEEGSGIEFPETRAVRGRGARAPRRLRTRVRRGARDRVGLGASPDDFAAAPDAVEEIGEDDVAAGTADDHVPRPVAGPRPGRGP